VDRREALSEHGIVTGVAPCRQMACLAQELAYNVMVTTGSGKNKGTSGTKLVIPCFAE